MKFNVQSYQNHTIVEFTASSLLDSVELDQMAEGLYKLVDEQDRRRLVLDFEKVQFIASRAVGMLMNLHKKLQALPNSKLILCGLSPRLLELLRITRLDKLLTIKPTAMEAVRSFDGGVE